MDYNSKNICLALKKANIKKGDIILCHSNLGFFGKPKGIKNPNSLCRLFFKSFMNVLGEDGTLIVPTFSYSFFKKEKFIVNTKSEMGIFSEYVRNLTKSKRSMDPNFSVSVYGKNKEYFCDTILNNTYDDESFFGKFHKKNGKIVTLNFLGSTILHYYERKLKVPYRFDKKFFGTVNGKKEIWVVFSRYLNKKFVHDPLPITKILRKKKYFFRSRLGKGEITSISSENFYRTVKNSLKNNKYILTEHHKHK
tara:strand:- start:300 stop:1052 length:753 start_codon:yes stop_codon:yes gene_type:complete